MRAAVAALAALLAVPPASAELQWITGGVPAEEHPASADTRVPDAPADAWGAPEAGNPDIVASHFTTCTRLAGQYPADSVNFFYRGRHEQVTYFAYFLMRPATRIHRVRVEWFDPKGRSLARQDQEFRVGFMDRLLTVGGGTYQWFLVTSAIGMNRPFPESFQTSIPREPGLYTIHLTVNGRLTGITFFYVKEPETTPVPVITPTVTGTSGGRTKP